MTPLGTPVVGKRILVVAGHAGSLRNFRGDLIRALLDRGHQVHAAAPGLSADPDTQAWLQKIGVVCHDVPMARTGINPAADLRTCFALWRLMRRIRAQVFFGYTVKPVIWGIIAARFAGVPGRIGLITGLGYAFTGEAKGKRRAIQWIAAALYGHALRQASLAFFQNPDDAADFGRLNLLPPDLPVVIVNGSGVDTGRYAPTPLPEGPIRFLMIARLVADKGVREFAEAARLLRTAWPEAQFELVGGLDSNPAAIPRAEVERWVTDGCLTWAGEMRDVRPALARAHIYVLPSYREGTPRTVLEAMSMARPVITTDAPGCRETVVDGVNGRLVPVRDGAALAAACLSLAQSPDLVAAMAQAARRMAVDRFDVHKVNAAMIAAMDL